MVDRPLRVAFVDYMVEPDTPGRSGLSDIVWDMASELVNQGHEPHVVASYHTSEYPDPRVQVHNFPTPPIGYRNIVGQLWILKRAADIVKRLKPDIVHAPEYLSTAVFSTYGVTTPLVLTVPGNIYHRLATPGGSSYEWYYAQILKWAAGRSARRCARVIAISEEMKWWWERTGSPPERTPCIPLGVDPGRFHRVDNARAALGLPGVPLLLVYVGRFAPEKGLLDLVNAVRQADLATDPSAVQIVLIGRGAQLGELLASIRSGGLQDLIHTRDWVAQHELCTWYSAADAVILPSRTEGFSRTIPEALSCGTPIIASRISGSADHVHEGETGITYRPGDVSELASLLRRVAANPAILRSLSTSSCAYARANLSWHTVMQRVSAEVYAPAMKANGTV